ncbi:MAG: DUF4445 domain-containing protein [Candidatus Omnitrophota bacterium]|jgi:uncharacterized 2Fe-2S/4Fe-4S cluster protein (DUF4445 family)|nr:MAG: DUF4445 domain-containing protein [Candidatus Omnitrophota bacterium]
MEKFKIKFYPAGKAIEVPKDANLLSSAISAGVYINASCGGDGVCGKCRVIVRKGKVNTQPTGMISSEEMNKNIYLACLTTVQSDLEVEVPRESTIGLEGLTPEDIHSRFKGFYSASEKIDSSLSELAKRKFVFKPQVIKKYLELEEPTITNPSSDLERLTKHLRSIPDFYPDKKGPIIPSGLVNIRQLSGLLRSSGWKITVVIGEKDDTWELLFVEPGDTAIKNYGFCFDIGTTTISGQLVDLNSEKILGTKITYNKQVVFGSDVITRIIYAGKKEGLEKLHLAVIDCIDQIIKELCQEHNISINDVTCITCAGNTTMIHLLLCIDPTFIRKEPYVATSNFMPAIRASEVGIRINHRGYLNCIPGVSSYVGGDITAGVLACGLNLLEKPSLLIDIGTNGEIVLGNREFLISCSASAGPAFEGSGLKCGMRASRGAIQKVGISKDGIVSFETIDSDAPRGICGSGYIDAIAQMLKAGLLDKDGKIKDAKYERVRNSEFGKEFVLVFKEDSGIKKDIVITEVDIDNIKRSKAAIYSAAETLLKHVDLSFDQISRIFIAGGFGTNINIESAIRIGLLPDLETKKFIFVGNTSLAGARYAIFSREARDEAGEIARKMAYFELSVDPKYMDEYMAALFFPHTDLNKFPSAKD